MNIDKPACFLDGSGIGARQDQEDLGAAREGRPRLDAIQKPAALRRSRRDRESRDVAAVIRLGDTHRHHLFAARDDRQPSALLLFGAALEKRLGEDLGARHQAAGDAEGAARQLFGDEDHAHVVGAFVVLETVVALRDGKPEAAHLPQPVEDRLRHQEIVAMHRFGERRDASSAKRRKVSRIIS
jgi:hypothetical protein